MSAWNLNNQKGLCGGTANAERGITSIARASEWWQHKLATALGIAYLTAGLYEVPAAALWWRLVVLLAAFVAGAFYVCVLNDVTDVEDDLRCGKRNRMDGRSKKFTAGALAIGPALGVLVGLFLMTGPLTRWFYAADWLAFTLYSMPPFRLKVRGAAGAIADACGGQMLPGLWVAAYIAESSGHLLDVRLGLCLALWGIAFGLRGILLHQIEDCERDRIAGVRTLLVRGNVASLQKLVRWVVFPVEIVALAGLLVLFGGPLPWLLLGVHLLLQWMRAKFFGIKVILVTPRPEGRVALAEYYQLLLPAAILLTMASGDRWVLLFLAAHLCLFPDVTGRFLRNVAHLVRWQCLQPVGDVWRRRAQYSRRHWLPRLVSKLRHLILLR
jgi:4-hydroxybenzoate polyprenyltransferase